MAQLKFTELWEAFSAKFLYPHDEIIKKIIGVKRKQKSEFPH